MPTLWLAWQGLVTLGLGAGAAATSQPAPAHDEIKVELLEGVPDKKAWEFDGVEPAERWAQPAPGFVGLPKKFSNRGLVIDRSNPFVVRATGGIRLAAGQYRVLLRSRGAARLFLDGRVILQTQFLNPNASGHEQVPVPPAADEDGLHALPVGHQQQIAQVELDAGVHEFRVEAFVGGQKLRPELGELVVGIAEKGSQFFLLSSALSTPLSDEGWREYAASCQAWLEDRDRTARKVAGAEEAKYWAMRHELARRAWDQKPAPEVPEVESKTPAHNAIDRFVGRRLEEAGVEPAPLTDDWAFLRRVTLDTVGVIPSRREIDAFARDERSGKRAAAIDRLLDDPRWADHWVGYWQDVLAENPGILKPTLNNTGPFRWWIHQAFRENLPMDRFATELVMMEGSAMAGGPAGFGMATQNDAPMAAKAHIVAKAFLGLELQCARCHDAPFHPFKQKELFSLAAMLGKGPLKVPSTSTVPKTERTRRPLIEVTLDPGAAVEPAWPFDALAPSDPPPEVLRDPKDPRERFAAILTSPRNERFAQVIANRLWQQYLGWGLVEPVDDWHDARPSHPDLLEFLARELVTHSYDLKHIARLILNSHTYQRTVQPAEPRPSDTTDRLFASPAQRRLSAEQMVDSLYAAVGKGFDAEELTMDPEGRRPVTEMINLGMPRRAWEFTSLSNERDRPALALPVAQSIVDVLTTFGWRESRQNPITVRDETPTPLQPLILANGVVGSRITRLSDGSAITELCLQDCPLPDLVQAVFLQILSRSPTDDEQRTFDDLLSAGYADRRISGSAAPTKRRATRTTAVSWSNHLSPEATRIKLELEKAARAGDPPTDRLRPEWRERMEDMIWSLVNSPEFLFVP